MRLNPSEALPYSPSLTAKRDEKARRCARKNAENVVNECNKEGLSRAEFTLKNETTKDA